MAFYIVYSFNKHFNYSIDINIRIMTDIRVDDHYHLDRGECYQTPSPIYNDILSVSIQKMITQHQHISLGTRGNVVKICLNVLND